jgi:ribosomal protein S7
MISLKLKKFNTFYYKFLGFLVKNGNKNKAKNIVDNAFSSASNQSNRSIIYLLKLVFSRLSVFVESKTIKVRKKSYIVPFTVSLKRRSYLISKWLMKAVSQNTSKQPTYAKIKNEILFLLKKSQSKAFKLKQLNNKQVLLNRSNAHFRW